MEPLEPLEVVEISLTDDTPIIEYTPDPIDEYLVIVNDALDWEEIHNYIINENEIDGIPNRKIECSNIKEYSLRSSVYMMSIEESEVLRSHPKVEDVLLNPDKYPRPESKLTNRFKKQVAYNKPNITGDSLQEQGYTGPYSTKGHTNGIRSNWGHLFINGNQTSSPYAGVGIGTTTLQNSDISYSLTGRNVDAIILDEGIGAVHPEFTSDTGTRRIKDLILDGPYKVDPTYFTSRSLTYTKTIDGVNFGVGIATTAGAEWWSDTTKRSSAFQSLGTVSAISALYTIGHALSKTTNSNSNQIAGGHGTACASQIGGKSFGLAFDCNLWNIRITFGDGYISSSTALDICTIFHNAKKISQPGNPDPTLINNSYGSFNSTLNASGTSYSYDYRGATSSYTGNGSNVTLPANSVCFRNTTRIVYRDATGTSRYAYTSTNGQYLAANTSTNSSAENAIAAGCIVVTAAGNNNQKITHYGELDFDNYYYANGQYVCRPQGVQKGYSTTTPTPGTGSIRVGALDCAVEPVSAKQGATAYSVRKVCYSANGPMIDVWAPAEYTMAAGYATGYESFVREDNSSFYDTWFNGTSSACPNTCSLVALYLESNRKATNADVRNWLNTRGSVEISLSDPYPDPTATGYWSQSFNSTYDLPSNEYEVYNIRGNGNLRGAPKKVLHNPFANNTIPSMSGVTVSGISFTQT